MITSDALGAAPAATMREKNSVMSLSECSAISELTGASPTSAMRHQAKGARPVSAWTCRTICEKARLVRPEALTGAAIGTLVKRNPAMAMSRPSGPGLFYARNSPCSMWTVRRPRPSPW